MNIKRSLVEIQIAMLQSDVRQYKLDKANGKQHTSSVKGLMDFSIYILSNLQLLSPTLDINKDDVLFKRIAKIQQQIRTLER